MSDNIAISPGSGVEVTTDQSSADGSQMQVVKLAVSALGVETLIPATLANGITCDVTRVQGVVIVNNPTAGNLKVDASGASVPVVNASATTLAVSAPKTAPVFVELSDGTNAIATLPVSGTFWQTTQPVSGTFWQTTQPVSGTVAATISGTWNINAVTSITDTVTVQGTATVTQGAAANLAGAWTTKITDGTSLVGVSTVSGSKCLNVSVLSTVGPGEQEDESAFTEGSTPLVLAGAVYNDSIGNPTSGQAAGIRITAYRGMHINLRNNGGTEIGTSGAPVRIDPTGGTTQPVSGTVTANQGTANATPWNDNVAQVGGNAVVTAANGVQTVGIVNAAGVAFSQAAPLQTQNAPSGGTGGVTQTPWKICVAISAGTAVAIHTPASGKTAYIEGYSLSISAVSATTLYIYDGTNTAATTVWGAANAWANQIVTVCPARPIPLAAVNNVLRYTAGSGVVADLTIWGFDS